mgnify:CR=1 FL=1
MTSSNIAYQFLRRPKVEEMTTLSRNKIYSLMKEGKFPKSIAIAPKVVVWVKKEVEEWIEDKNFHKSID